MDVSRRTLNSIYFESRYFETFNLAQQLIDRLGTKRSHDSDCAVETKSAKIWMHAHNVPSSKVRKFISTEFNILSRKNDRLNFVCKKKDEGIAEFKMKNDLLENSVKQLQHNLIEKERQIEKLKKVISVLSE